MFRPPVGSAAIFPAALGAALVLAPNPAHATWAIRPSGTSVTLHDVSAHHGSGGMAWACGDQGTILKTTDAGVTWVALNSGTTVDLHGIAFLEANGSPVVAVGNGGTILRSLDFGDTWIPIASGTTADLEEISDFGHYIVGDGGTILSSSDAGATWTAENSGTTANLLGVTGAFVKFAVGEGGIAVVWRGITLQWVPYDTGVDADLYGVPMFASSGLAVGDGGTVVNSTDFGNTWSTVDVGTPAGLRACEYSQNNTQRMYMVGENGTILKTTDGGISWFRQLTPTAENLLGVFFYLNDQHGYVVGENGMILTTDDGGGPPPVASPARIGDTAALTVTPLPVRGESASLEFTLARAGRADVRVYDVRGALRETIRREHLDAGPHRLLWNPSLASGTYFVRVVTETETRSARVVLVR
ncbi:MAG: hypothetical protein R3B81_14625 [bacterium]